MIFREIFSSISFSGKETIVFLFLSISTAYSSPASSLLESFSFGFLQDSSKDKSVISLSEIEFCPKIFNPSSTFDLPELFAPIKITRFPISPLVRELLKTNLSLFGFNSSFSFSKPIFLKASNLNALSIYFSSCKFSIIVLISS